MWASYHGLMRGWQSLFGFNPFPPSWSGPIRREEFHRPQFWQKDHQQQLLSPYGGRTFIFCRRHNRLFERGRWVVRFWGRWHGEEKGIKKAFWANDGKGKSLWTKDNKSDVKGGNESTAKRSIVLMKLNLCFRITAKLRNSKRQPYSWKERK